MTTKTTQGEIRQKSINYFFCGTITDRIVQLYQNFRTKAEAESFADRHGLEVFEAILRYNFDFEVEYLFDGPILLTLDDLKAQQFRKAAAFAGGLS